MTDGVRCLTRPCFAPLPISSSATICFRTNATDLRSIKPNNKLVWDETIRILYDLFDNVWGAKDNVEIDNITDLTVPVRRSFEADASPHSLTAVRRSLFW